MEDNKSNDNDAKEKSTQLDGEVKPEGIGKPVAEVSSISVKKDGIGGQPDAEAALAEMRARLTPEEAVAVREKLQQRSDEAFEKADFKTAAALRSEAQQLDAKGLKLTPAQADSAKALLEKRAEDAEKAGDLDAAKKLREEGEAIGQETSGDVGSGSVLLLLGAAALGLYVVSERQRQAQQAAAAAQAQAAAMALARQQSQDNHRG